MPTDTSTPVLTGEQIYNLLMNEIEPELTTDMLPLLPEMYKDVSPEEEKARSEWYAEAFEIFLKQYDQFVGGWKNYYEELRRKAMTLGRETAEASEKQDTQSIEQSIQNS